MHRRKMNWRQIASYLLVLVTSAGCFQAMGTDLVATEAGQQPPTFTPFPSDTPVPSPLPLATNTPLLPLADLDDEVEPDAIDPQALLETDLTELQLTMTADFVPGALITPAGEPLTEPMDEVISEPIDSGAMTATAIIQAATARFATQTAVAGGFVGVATQPPVLVEPQAVVSPGATLVDAAPLVAGEDCIHEVRATDVNLYRIALNYGLTYQDIARANNLLNPDRIYVGDRLVIPGCGTTGVTPLPTSTPRPGQAEPTIAPAQAAGTSTPLAVTFTPVPEPGSQTTGAEGRVHIVQQGETLFQLSMRYGVPVVQIAAANNIADYNRIYLGQRLIIP